LGETKYRGVFHCFSGTLEQAKKCIDLGFLLGIGGVVTYKKSGLDEVVREIPLEHIVLETDDPWLTPVPHRGKRNEPSYLFHVAQKVAEIKNISLLEVAEITTKNAQHLFNIQN
jgi:TatD DNase family protein